MKEIIQLLNSNNLDDRVLGVIMSVEQGVWEEVAKDEFRGQIVDSLIKTATIKDSRIMRYKNRWYCLFPSYVARYNKDIITTKDVKQYTTRSEIYYDDERENN